MNKLGKNWKKMFAKHPTKDLYPGYILGIPLINDSIIKINKKKWTFPIGR